MSLYAMKANFRTIRNQVSQPPSAGNVADMSDLQAQNCMTLQQWTRFLRSVSVNIRKQNCHCNNLVNMLLSSFFRNFWLLVPVSRWWQIPILSCLRTPMNTGEYHALKQRTSYTYFHLSSKSNPAMGRNEDILMSGSEVKG